MKTTELQIHSNRLNISIETPSPSEPDECDALLMGTPEPPVTPLKPTLTIQGTPWSLTSLAHEISRAVGASPIKGIPGGARLELPELVINVHCVD